MHHEDPSGRSNSPAAPPPLLLPLLFPDFLLFSLFSLLSTVTSRALASRKAKVINAYTTSNHRSGDKTLYAPDACIHIHQPAALIRTKVCTVYYILHRCMCVNVCVVGTWCSSSLTRCFHAHRSRRCAISNLTVAAVKATNFALTLISRTVPKKRRQTRNGRERRKLGGKRDGKLYHFWCDTLSRLVASRG